MIYKNGSTEKLGNLELRHFSLAGKYRHAVCVYYRRVLCIYYKCASSSTIDVYCASTAHCTLSPSAFGEILERELHDMRLGECNSLHSCRELFILAYKTTRKPGETARHERLRLQESIGGEASVFIYILTLALSQVLAARVYSWYTIDMSLLWMHVIIFMW